MVGRHRNRHRPRCSTTLYTDLELICVTARSVPSHSMTDGRAVRFRFGKRRGSLHGPAEDEFSARFVLLHLPSGESSQPVTVDAGARVLPDPLCLCKRGS
jgi:hypothetical protein